MKNSNVLNHYRRKLFTLTTFNMLDRDCGRFMILIAFILPSVVLWEFMGNGIPFSKWVRESVGLLTVTSIWFLVFFSIGYFRFFRRVNRRTHNFRESMEKDLLEAG